jgi:hypothetical protein
LFWGEYCFSGGRKLRKKTFTPNDVLYEMEKRGDETAENVAE